MKTYDFSGYATKNDLKCSDGRTIRRDAFKDCDGMVVPLVWQHVHNDPNNVLGHALLENRDDGVYCYGSFNETEAGINAKEFVQHGDINSLSIYANKLVQHGGDVLHGAIREVSLVLTGANPGALIDNLSIAHSDGGITPLEDEAIIFSPCDIIEHSEGEDNMSKYDASDVLEILVDAAITGKEVPEGVAEVFESLSEEAQDVIAETVGEAMSICEDEDEDDEDEYDEEDSDDSEDGGSCEHSGMTSDKTIGDIVETMTEEQKQAMYALIGIAAKTNNNIEHGGIDMKTNVFENSDELMHSELDFDELVADARRFGSLGEAFLAHAGDNTVYTERTTTYGISGIDNLKPGVNLVTKEPDMVKRRTEWVDVVLNAVHRSPFSRIKTTYANIEADEARARGYVTGNQKANEIILALKRTTTPTTVYKLQKLDRDDIIDITDFDVVAWIKKEMRLMLDEEIARAILIGDGRSSSSNDKIDPACVRPIYGDDAAYVLYGRLSLTSGMTNKQMADVIAEGALRNRETYLGKGTPTFFCTTETLDTLLLAQDLNGHRIYRDVADVAAALRCSAVVEVPVMKNLSRTVTESGSSVTLDCDGIIVNLADYNVGADKGGNVSMFDDFDIDFNQQKYLIETRISGALVHPRSAIVLEHVHIA